jgi:hypothetical protein
MYSYVQTVKVKGEIDFCYRFDTQKQMCIKTTIAAVNALVIKNKALEM